MKTKVRMVGKVAIVELSGKITIGEGDVVLRDEVNKLLEADNKSILLNLNGVTYMDSAGIGELVACYKRAREKGGRRRSARWGRWSAPQRAGHCGTSIIAGVRSPRDGSYCSGTLTTLRSRVYP